MRSKTQSGLGVLFILFVAFLILVAAAHADGKGHGTKNVNVVMTLNIHSRGYALPFTEFYSDKGPIYCVTCGEIVPKYDLQFRLKSVRVRVVSDEKIVSANYYYTARDKSGDFDGMNFWNGRGSLPATKWHTDAQGKLHKLYLKSVTALVYLRPLKRHGLLPDHEGGTV
jgi:hypothetical protein